MNTTDKTNKKGEREPESRIWGEHRSWLWPDSRAPKVSILRAEHNHTINELERVKQQRDELLAACKALLGCVTLDSDMQEDFASEIAQAKVAIVKAEKGAGQ